MSGPIEGGVVPAGTQFVCYCTPIRVDVKVPEQSPLDSGEEAVADVQRLLGDEATVTAPPQLVCRDQANMGNGLTWVEYAMAPRHRPALEIKVHDHDGPAFTLPDGFTGCRLVDTTIRLHDRGVAVFTTVVEFSTDRSISIASFRRAAESIGSGPLVEFAGSTTSRILDRARSKLEAYQDDYASDRFRLGGVVGFHRLYVIDDDVRRGNHPASVEMITTADLSEAQNSAAERDRFCFVGNGASLFSGPDVHWSDDLSPLQVIQYYQHYYFSLMLLDESLSSAIARFSRSETDRKIAVGAQAAVEALGDSAHQFQSAHLDALSTLPPQHMAYWRQMEDQWYTREIEAALQLKTEHLELLARRIAQNVSNQLARRTSLIVTAFTCLTLVTFLLDAVSFSSSGSITISFERLWVVGLGLIVALSAFVAIYRNTREQMAR